MHASRSRRLLLVFVAVAVLSGCGALGYKSSAVNELCLIYSGGTWEEKEYKGLLDPGSTNEGTGIGSSTYCYRIDQRSYIASAQDGRGDTRPVQVAAKGEVEGSVVRMNVEYQLYFTLNQDEDVIRAFHENLGVKTEAWDEDGWVTMLQEYFEPQIERALETAALRHDWRALYADEEARREFQRDTVSTLQQNIRDVIGGDYFCGPAYDGTNECGAFTFTVGKPEPVNADIISAIERRVEAEELTAAQAQENERIAAQVEGEERLVELYGAQGALLLKAIESGVVQIMVVPEGGEGVTVPVPVPTTTP